MVESFVKESDKYTIYFTIFSLIFIFIKDKYMGNKITIDTFLVKCFACASIPNGLLVVIAALEPDYITNLKDIRMYLLVIGVTFIFISAREAFTNRNNRN